MGEVTRDSREPSEAGPFIALFLYAVRGLWPAREVLRPSARYAVSCAEKPLVFDRSEGLGVVLNAVEQRFLFEG